MRIVDLNALDGYSATRELLRCCGSSRWAREMAAARPFLSVEAMSEVADAIWSALDRPDWLEAFAAHPKIGATRAGGAGEAGWPDDEQAGVAGAGDRTKQRLDAANRDYEARFGYIFIVCATGRSADEMLALLEGRVRHDAGEELPIAAEEQRRITQLRLRKLMT